MVFILTGAVGLVLAAFWFAFLHEPHRARRANQAELDYIAQDDPWPAPEKITFSSLRKAKVLVTSRQMWGI